jgi:SAM-dependent methyltransferase
VPPELPATAGPPEAAPPAVWRAWYERWNRFQEAYVPHRAKQFGVMADYVSLWWGEGAVRALDLASGPGCVAEHLLRALPGARVDALDCDPWLLEMGRQALAGENRLRWVDADLRDGGWKDLLPSPAYEAVLSATALHWLTADELRRTYGVLAEILVEDGLFLNADIMTSGTPAVGRLSHGALERWRAGALAGPGGEAWHAFWGEAAREPAFGELLDERDRRLGPRRPFMPPTLDFHRDALMAAGFREVGEVWRCHSTAILIAIR